MTDNSFTLVDDGTLDTVIKCDHCGIEYRFNYDGSLDEEESQDGYPAFVEWCMNDMDADHECELTNAAQ